MSTIRKLPLLGMILILAPLSAQAVFYKWVDENGVTQYTQSPPPSGGYQEMSSPPPPASTSEQQPAATASPQQDSTSAPAKTPSPDPQMQAKRQHALEQNCQIARQNLDLLENHARLRVKAADGSLRVMSEQEKQAKLEETRKMLDENCR
ncbi:MAG: DUF4124 domain-containing protein [Gammaproteobacteria bacterium]|jgi:hypothetical protein